MLRAIMTEPGLLRNASGRSAEEARNWATRYICSRSRNWINVPPEYGVILFSAAAGSVVVVSVVVFMVFVFCFCCFYRDTG